MYFTNKEKNYCPCLWSSFKSIEAHNGQFMQSMLKCGVVVRTAPTERREYQDQDFLLSRPEPVYNTLIIDTVFRRLV